MHPLPTYLYTDGASIGNPGPGGYAAILTYQSHEKIITGGFAHTTNNRMELMAVITGLAALKRPCDNIHIYTDSRYIVDAINKGWLTSWLAHKNFKRKKNPDLWRSLYQHLQQHQVVFHWIKGHAGHPYNERCDQLAVAAAQQPNLPPDRGYRAYG